MAAHTRPLLRSSKSVLSSFTGHAFGRESGIWRDFWTPEALNSTPELFGDLLGIEFNGSSVKLGGTTCWNALEFESPRQWVLDDSQGMTSIYDCRYRSRPGKEAMRR